MELLNKAIRWAFWIEENFLWFVTAHMWTSLAADTTATVAVADTQAGGVALFTDATDNNEAAIRTTNEIFKFAAGKPILFEASISYTEANTDDANVFVGLMDAIGANAMVDNGAGPKSSFSGAGFYKVDGGTRWQFITSIGTTRTTVDLVLTDKNNLSRETQTAGGAQTLRIEVEGDTLTALKVSGFIDDVLVAQHIVDCTSATEMHGGAYVKAGGSNAETLTVKYIRAGQGR